MNAFDYWISADALNVYQLALLTALYNPSEFETTYANNWPGAVNYDTKPHIVAVKNAMRAGIIKPFLEEITDRGEFDWGSTLIAVSDYRDWLTRRGITNSIFHQAVQADDYISPYGPFYAAKLAAAVAAWKAVTADPARWRGKSPKKALEAWLRENATTYGLVNKDGSPNETGIAEVAKVANWKPAGGAPATPATQTLPQVLPEPSPGFGKTPPQVPANPPHSSRLADLDDDIPF